MNFFVMYAAMVFGFSLHRHIINIVYNKEEDCELFTESLQLQK